MTLWTPEDCISYHWPYTLRQASLWPQTPQVKEFGRHLYIDLGKEWANIKTLHNLRIVLNPPWSTVTLYASTLSKPKFTHASLTTNPSWRTIWILSGLWIIQSLWLAFIQNPTLQLMQPPIWLRLINGTPNSIKSAGLTATLFPTGSPETDTVVTSWTRVAHCIVYCWLPTQSLYWRVLGSISSGNCAEWILEPPPSRMFCLWHPHEKPPTLSQNLQNHSPVDRKTWELPHQCCCVFLH